MKQVKIFKECKEREELESLINDWVKTNEKKVISVDVKTYVVRLEDALLDNLISVYWFAIVTYEE